MPNLKTQTDLELRILYQAIDKAFMEDNQPEFFRLLDRIKDLEGY